MTASIARMEEGKPPGAGRCLLAANDFPLRQPRRISDLETPAQPSSPGWVTCGGALDPSLGRRRFFFPLTKHDQLGGDLLREGAQRLPGIGFVHVSNMEKTNDRVVAPAYVNPRG